MDIFVSNSKIKLNGKFKLNLNFLLSNLRCLTLLGIYLTIKMYLTNKVFILINKIKKSTQIIKNYINTNFPWSKISFK